MNKNNNFKNNIKIENIKTFEDVLNNVKKYFDKTEVPTMNEIEKLLLEAASETNKILRNFAENLIENNDAYKKEEISCPECKKN